MMTLLALATSRNQSSERATYSVMSKSGPSESCLGPEGNFDGCHSSSDFVKDMDVGFDSPGCYNFNG